MPSDCDSPISKKICSTSERIPFSRAVCGFIFFLRRFFNISFSCTFYFDNRRRDDVIFVQWQCRYLCQSQSFSSLIPVFLFPHPVLWFVFLSFLTFALGSILTRIRLIAFTVLYQAGWKTSEFLLFYSVTR